jgi:plastocyanin
VPTSEPAPAGYSFGNTQIDISAPTASPTNPLTIVFTVKPPSGTTLDDTTLLATDIYRAEGTGTPQPIPTCNTAAPVDPQPACVANRQYVPINGTTYIQVTVSAVSASHWNSGRPNSAAVSVSNSGYTPATTTTQIGGRVNWTFTGSKSHSATDALGLGTSAKPLFDSGAKSSGSYSVGFPAAGSYSYRSTVKGDTMTGTVQVPVAISQPAAGTYVLHLGRRQAQRLRVRCQVPLQSSRHLEIRHLDELQERHVPT